MRGPIDYIVVGFTGNKFDGSIAKALDNAVSAGTIAVLALTVVSKDKDGNLTTLDMQNLGDEQLVTLTSSPSFDNSLVTEDDVAEVGDLLENETTAGLLVVEQLWAKPFKEALIKANGVLVAEGRIHPDAEVELNA